MFLSFKFRDISVALLRVFFVADVNGFDFRVCTPEMFNGFCQTPGQRKIISSWF